MSIKLEDVDLKDINKVLETAQAELNQEGIQFNKNVERLNRQGLATPNDIPETHITTLKNIKKKYAQSIINICSNRILIK